jgi:kinesin family protein 5
LTIREDPKTGQFFVDQLTHVVVENPMQLLELISVGALNRAASATAMNKDSSRSHVLLFVTVDQAPILHPETREIGKIKSGVLTIVDLAGSERLSKTGSEGQRLEEAKCINKSLSALGNCVAALAASIFYNRIL